MRLFGRSRVMVPALGFGRLHIGDIETDEAAIRLIRYAVDGGITYFDNCWEYHRGKTEQWMGSALKGLRD
ncbi:MAG: aldo/keto reductase [Candidatus Solibacter sp.]|jgi:aryl-alcohol dehydrogenase-like predicted oxidoreductase|nr:aldo/keto reductase [Candidatus Solibacter sp.]